MINSESYVQSLIDGLDEDFEALVGSPVFKNISGFVKEATKYTYDHLIDYEAIENADEESADDSSADGSGVIEFQENVLGRPCVVCVVDSNVGLGGNLKVLIGEDKDDVRRIIFVFMRQENGRWQLMPVCVVGDESFKRLRRVSFLRAEMMRAEHLMGKDRAESFFSGLLDFVVSNISGFFKFVSKQESEFVFEKRGQLNFAKPTLLDREFLLGSPLKRKPVPNIESLKTLLALTANYGKV